jgi:hypothetical protein
LLKAIESGVIVIDDVDERGLHELD